ncbi:MAG: NAD(P)/FAD-dependent oxidoreductase [Gemmatimonadales bacterium]
MDLKSGYPFWAIKNGLMHAFPPLRDSIRSEVVVLGGGITGAVIADHLATHGHEVVVLEARDVGWGSTAASTALLQYELDTHLVDLVRRYGEPAAVQAYHACAAAIPRLGELAREIRDVGFAKQDSLYLASRPRDLRGMRREYALRARHGLPVTWLDTGDIAERYGISAPGGILSSLAARIDPYRMANRLLMRLERQGGRVFDRTAVTTIEPLDRGVSLRTREGVPVRCRHLVVATGYVAQTWLPKRLARNRSSYAFMTDPVEPDGPGILARTMIWESARPYLYLRSTTDGRLLVGGADDAADVPARRDRRVEKKAAALAAQARKLLPEMTFRPAFSWAGTFAETDDGMPFIGAHPKFGPRVRFALAYGGNGIPFSIVGADLVMAAIERRAHPLAALMSFERLE